MYAVIDGIPILSVDEEDHAAQRQHLHQKEFYGKVFRTDRPYRLENWQRAYLRRMTSLWTATGPQTPFLDSGAGGDAYTVIEAARRGIPSVGCDLSLEAMLSAKGFAATLGLAEQCLFVVASAEALPFADDVFGASCSIAVLEHVPDDKRAIVEIARVTRPGGRVYFAVPNSLERAPALLRPFYKRHDGWVGHLRHYSDDELRTKCIEAGLQPTQTIYSAHWSKVVQLAVDLALTRVRLPHDRLWWWFEEFDADASLRSDGLHLNLVLERTPGVVDNAGGGAGSLD